MNFTCVTNVPAFFRCIAACSSDVMLIEKNGDVRDLKQLAQQASGFEALFGEVQLRDVEVQASALEDRRRLMRHMAEMARK